MEKENYSNTLNDSASFFYKQSKPIRPHQTLIGIGEHLLRLSDELMKIEASGKTYILIANHVFDIAPHISNYAAEHDQKVEVLSFNLRFFELLTDLIMFHEHRNEETALYIYSKYARFFAAANNSNTAIFFNWLFLQTGEQNALGCADYLRKAGCGSIFVLMHEWLHKQRELVSDTQKMILSSEKIEKLRQELKLDKVKMEEVYCDFSALALNLYYKIEKALECTETEFAGVSMLALCIEGVYDYLRRIRIPVTGMMLGEYNSITEVLEKTVLERVQLLAVAAKIAHNSGVFLHDCDADAALQYTRETITGFLTTIADVYNEMLPEKIAQYNSLTEEKRKEYLFSMPTYDWHLFS